jgi:hypothetical protein
MQSPILREMSQNAGAAAKLEKVGAAAHGDMLAVVDKLPRLPVDERSGAPAESPLCLEQVHGDSFGRECRGGSKPGQDRRRR